MSNGILPVQSTRPTLREWLLTRLFSDSGISQEFYNRLMNLCNYDYPMSPALRGYVESTFGFELVGVIEQYRDREKPVLSGGMRNTFRRIIPDEFFLEFVRIFDCDCCPPIIQEVSDISLAIPGTAIGQLTVERYIDMDGNQHIHLYEWDGGAWVEVIDSSVAFLDGFIDGFKVDYIASNWEVSADEGVTWHQNNTPIIPPIESLIFWFRNTINGCVYTNLPIMPLEITYCADYVYFDNSGDPGFLFGTINGADAGDQVAVIASYANWQGNVTSRAYYDPVILPALIIIYRDSLSTAFTNLGTYQDIALNPPVTIPIDGNLCTRHCYQAVFTVDDIADMGLRTINFMGGRTHIFNVIPFGSIDVNINNLVELQTEGILEPSATLTYGINGNEVTMTVCSSIVFESMAWSRIDLSDPGTANFVQIS